MNIIKALRELRGLSQTDLAELVGTSQPQIRRLEAGERKLTKEWAERLAGPLQATAEQILFDSEIDVSHVTDVNVNPNQEPDHVDPRTDLPNARVRGKVEGLGRKIPVYGQAVGGLDGEFLMNGTILYEVMAPPAISHIRDAYAVLVSGDSMAPRYEDGEVCFIDPMRRVKRGDYVIAQVAFDEHAPPLAYVKKFIRHNSAELVLEQFNPPKELRFPGSNVVSVHFIALAGIA
ncbi:helix-turn-helix domain-containing protein [Ensifer canadensis]|uniref:helix-turn-helix domain-containing protein n=1 Tax=Ensifer canadensis TaxID=555315 RepID=UPI0035E3BE8B